ncbi:hypothetical protein KCV05_g18, partial [Aureobasidium melanogenum]
LGKAAKSSSLMVFAASTLAFSGLTACVGSAPFHCSPTKALSVVAVCRVVSSDMVVNGRSECSKVSKVDELMRRSHQEGQTLTIAGCMSAERAEIEGQALNLFRVGRSRVSCVERASGLAFVYHPLCFCMPSIIYPRFSYTNYCCNPYDS